MDDLRTDGRGCVDRPDYPDDGPFADAHDVKPADHRWRGVAATAGGVLLVAVIATAVIVNGGGGGPTAAMVGPPPTRTVIATPGPATSTAPRPPPLAPETVSTLTPSSARPSPSPTATSTPEAGATPGLSAVDPRTFVYTVTGTKPLLDLVSVIYTDAHGYPRTEFDVVLPWTRTVTLDPGVGIKSVVATSLSARLNCTIANAMGQMVVASGDNTIITTCTR